MKTLIITRHGKAVPADGKVHDRLRDLAPRGYKDLRIIATELNKLGLIPGLILSSPAVRTTETANLLAAKIGDRQIPIVTRDSLYLDFQDEVFGFLESVCPEESTVLVAGHNPSLIQMIENLTGEIVENFPTSATAVIDFTTDSWSLLPGSRGVIRKLIMPRNLK